MSHHDGTRSSKGPTRLVVVSGCSGGGKSTLLAALAGRGIATVSEPGRRIVREELAGTGDALPWRNPVAFARRALAMAREDRASALRRGGISLFDRGMVDAAAALERACGEPAIATLEAARLYDAVVFLTPPWPEIYRQEEERPHGFEAAIAEYDHLRVVYAQLGYDIVTLPLEPVAARASLVLQRLGLA